MRWLSLTILIILCSCRGIERQGAAPLWEEKKNESVSHQRALGPIYEDIKTPQQERFALRPFYSHEQIPSEDAEARDWLWPLGMERRYENYQWNWAAPVFWSNEDIHDVQSPWHLLAFPFYYAGKSEAGEDYQAIFPFYGRVCDFAGYDWIDIRCWPVYSRSKRSDVYGESWCWPFYAKHEKKDGSYLKKRYFPFYHSAYAKDKYEQYSILWPFWNSGHSLTKTKGEWFMAWPFYGSYEYGDEKRKTYLWPFFSTYESEHSRSKNLPWPFYSRATSDIPKEGKVRRDRFWPFYMCTEMDDRKNETWAWPFVHSYQQTHKDGEGKSFYVLPFYWNFSNSSPSAGVEDYTRIWPFYSKDEKDGKTFVRCLDLWPARTHTVIERNWAPFWTLYSHYHDEKTLTEKREILWGLYRTESNPKEKYQFTHIFPFYRNESKAEDHSNEWLYGLYGKYQSKGKNSRRLLWLFQWDLENQKKNLKK